MFKSLDPRVKNMTVMDIGCLKWGVLFATIILVKLFPQLLKIDYWVLLLLAIILLAKPTYSFWLKK